MPIDEKRLQAIEKAYEGSQGTVMMGQPTLRFLLSELRRLAAPQNWNHRKALFVREGWFASCSCGQQFSCESDWNCHIQYFPPTENESCLVCGYPFGIGRQAVIECRGESVRSSALT